MPPSKRNRHSFHRSGNTLKAETKTLIICEDEKSCRQYIESAINHYRVTHKYETHHCGRTDALGIVKFAVNNPSKLKLNRRRIKIDQLLCVIDEPSAVNRVNFDRAMELAKKKKIEMIVSYPCFEYWLLLHVKDTTMQFGATPGKSPADACISELKQHSKFKNYDKSNVESYFVDLGESLLNEAIARSEKILKDAMKIGSMHPSTAMHLLINRFRADSIGPQSEQ